MSEIASPEGNGTNTAAEEVIAQCEGKCSCEHPCRCMRPYTVKIRFVTRLAGIPVTGIDITQKNTNEAITNGPIDESTREQEAIFSSQAEEISLKCVYKNTSENMKPETVSIELRNLLPSCTATTQASAQFTHEIYKIRDILNIPEDDALDAAKQRLREAEEELAEATRELEEKEAAEKASLDEEYKAQESAQDSYDDASTTVETANQTRNQRITELTDSDTNSNDFDADFIDTYEVNAIEYSPEGNEANSDSRFIQSILAVEKDDENGIIYHLRVSLATFNLRVPYLSQLAGGIFYEEVDGVYTGVHTINAPYIPEENLDATNQATSGEALCSVTSSAMILGYYGVLITDRAREPTGDNGIAADVPAETRNLLLSRAGIYSHFFPLTTETKTGKNEDGATYTYTVSNKPWKNFLSMRNIVQAIYETYDTHNIDVAEVNSNINDFEQTMTNFIQHLSSGDPIYTAIKGEHILVVRGVVVSQDTTSTFAICNDPYGTLSGSALNYRNFTNREVWYGTGRPERNTQNSILAVNGKNVYYNDTTHTRNDSSHSAAHFGFRNSSLFRVRLAQDAETSDRDFAAQHLVDGDAGDSDE